MGKQHNKVIKSCPVCGSVFERYYCLNRKFCSFKCYINSEDHKTHQKVATNVAQKANIGTHRSKEIKDKISLGNKGHVVSKSTRQKMSIARKKRVTKDTTRVKMSEAQFRRWNSPEGQIERAIFQKRSLGSLNPSWRGGVSYEPYCDLWTDSLKKEIKTRDGCMCQMCSGKSGIKTLDVHHIDENKCNCSRDNLITLCHRCHLSLRKNFEYWYGYFRGYMFSMYGG